MSAAERQFEYAIEHLEEAAELGEATLTPEMSSAVLAELGRKDAALKAMKARASQEYVSVVRLSAVLAEIEKIARGSYGHVGAKSQALSDIAVRAALAGGERMSADDRIDYRYAADYCIAEDDIATAANDLRNAADEIDALRAKMSRYRHALAEIADDFGPVQTDAAFWAEVARNQQSIARAALDAGTTQRSGEGDRVPEGDQHGASGASSNPSPGAALTAEPAETCECGASADHIHSDRSLCACGSMHYHCDECGAQADPCVWAAPFPEQEPDE